MMNYELKQALRPVKMKIRRNRFLRGTVTGLAAGLGTAVLLQAVSFFVPVPDRGLWAAAAGAAVMLLTAIGNALRPVKNNTAAETADACGVLMKIPMKGRVESLNAAMAAGILMYEAARQRG